MSHRPYSIQHATLWALSRRGVTPTARMVLAALWTYLDWQGGGMEVWPARDTLGERLGLSRRAIVYAITELAQAGLIARERHGSSRITLVAPDDSIAGEGVQKICTPSAENLHTVRRISARAENLHGGVQKICTSGGAENLHGGGAENLHVNAQKICTQSRTYQGEDQGSQINQTNTEHTGGGAPLALIPDEQIETVEPEDPEILAVIEAHNATAARYNEHISERAKWLARIRLPTRASKAKRKRDDLRTLIRDRIEEYGLDDVIATVKAYGLIAYHESEVRGWYGSRMYSERSFAIARSQVAAGTSKRFRTEKERVAWQLQHAGRQEITTYQSTIVERDMGGMPVGTADDDYRRWCEDLGVEYLPDAEPYVTESPEGADGR